jgi:diguanylate cyclase (GGDEF)-like protein
MATLLMVGDDNDLSVEAERFASRLGLAVLRCPDAAAAATLLHRQVEVVVVDGGDGESHSALPQLLQACQSCGLPLLHVGAPDALPGEKDLPTDLFDVLPPPLAPRLLERRLALLLEVRRLRRELDARALEVEVLQAELAEFSSLDHDTGLFSQRYFIEDLAKEWRQAGRNSTPLSLLLLEIDGYASFLRQHGREEAVSSLCLVARALYQSLMRPSDLLARFGERGFAILLPETDGDGAELVATRLRHAVASLATGEDWVLHEGVSLSIGCAWHLPGEGDADGSDGEALLDVAGEALARAAAAGGGRTVLLAVAGDAGHPKDDAPDS